MVLFSLCFKNDHIEILRNVVFCDSDEVVDLLGFCKILIFYVSCDRSTIKEKVITVQPIFWKLNFEGPSFVLLKVTCSPYGINHIGLAIQDLD